MEQGQAAPAAAPSIATGDLRGVPEPVARIQAILNAERADQEQAPQAQPPAAPQEQVPAQPEANPEAEAPAGPNKQTEGDEATTEDARRMAEIPLDQLEAIELETTYKGDDGRDVTEKLPVKALREGYMRQKDYQRKTAEVARMKEAQAEQTRQAIAKERAAYQVSLQQAHDLVLENIAPELKNANWDDLAANNAFEFVRLTNMKDKVVKALSTIQAKQQEVSRKQEAELATAKQESIAKAQAELQDGIPGWTDAMYQTLMTSVAPKHGFKPEEVATWMDARAIKLLHKANLYDQLQAEKTAPAAEKRVTVPPKVVRPGAVQNTNQQAQREQGALKQLQTSGKILDAAAVIKSRFG